MRLIYIGFVLLFVVGCGESSDSGATGGAAVLVSAGADQVVDQMTTVTLHGGVDDSLAVAGLQWEQISGTTVTLSDSYSLTTTFQAPDVAIEESLEFRLTVYTTAGASYVDDVAVTVRLNPRFVKIGGGGEELPGSAEDWDCVKDTETGLYWEKKKTGTDPYHYIGDKFTWYQDGVGYIYGSTYTYEDCNSSVFGLCNTEKMANTINNTMLCGFFDWRLPTVADCQSFGGYPDADYIPHYKPIDYWTAEQADANSSYTCALDGRSTVTPHDIPLYVILVRP